MSDLVVHKPVTALAAPQRAVVALNSGAKEKALKELAEKHKSIVEIRDKDSFDDCRSARLECKNARISVTKDAKDVREDANAFAKAVVAEENRLVAIIEREEDRLQALENQYNERLTAAKKAREDAAREHINRMKRQTDGAVSQSAAIVATLIEEIQSLEISLEAFEELTGETAMVKDECLTRLRGCHAAALQREAQDAVAEAQRKELEVLRAEKAQRDQVDAERRQAEEDALRIEREQEEARRVEEQAAETIRQQEERDRQERELAARREAIQQEAAAAQKKRDDEQALFRMRMQEISGIAHQVLIASGGRSGVRIGGTVDCIRDTLAETEAWDVSEEKFGALIDAAKAAKERAIGSIRALLEQRLERDRATKEASERAEAERIHFEADKLRREAAADLLAACKAALSEAPMLECAAVLRKAIQKAEPEFEKEAA